MTTVDDPRAAAHAAYIASLLTPEEIRRSALSCLVTGDSAELMRHIADLHLGGLDPVWLAWADEIEMLNACGFTGRTAREAAKISLVVNGAAAAEFRHPLAHEDSPGRRRRLLAVADEMDALVDEGFDAETYAKEIELACGGLR